MFLCHTFQVWQVKIYAEMSLKPPNTSITMHDEILSYIESNKQRFLDELFDLIRIPSISANKKNQQDMQRCVEHLKKSLLEAGVDSAEIYKTDGHPILVGQKMVDTSYPTVLVYGHYDVQPVAPLEKWHSPPFEPEIRDGKIYARGADDDKGQLFMHVKAFEWMQKTDNLPCNVKFLIEGEEEIGSASLSKFCKTHAGLLSCDVILISDTSMIAQDTPSITVGLRGICNLQIDVRGPNRDLHSGLYGGAVANPANTLARIIASLHDENQHIAIPGFYNDVADISFNERQAMAKAPFDLNDYKRKLQIHDVIGEQGFSTTERTAIRPSLDVNGMWSGYTGEGSKTILPSTAGAKISMRLVPNQNYQTIAKQFTDYVKSIAPKGVEVDITYQHGGSPYSLSIYNPAYEAASKALKITFGKEPIPVRSGGSIPIVALFESALKAKSVLLGFGLDSDAIHSPNENYPLFNFFKGIESIPLFYANYAKLNI